MGQAKALQQQHTKITPKIIPYVFSPLLKPSPNIQISMPYITPNLRLLFSSSSSSSSSSLLSLRPPSLSLLSKPALFSILSSSKRHRPTSSTPPKRTSLTLHSRSKSTFPKKTPMEETTKESSSSSSFGFNKRRAEGRDGVDKQKKNLQLKTRRLNPTNTISYVQILGTGMDTQDTSPSVLLFFDKQRFIFNAGEGLQRFCTEHKIKLSKIDHIFLSRVCSETAGGLPGLLLTLAGMGEEGMSVNIWGPSDFKYLVDAMKSFIPHAAMVHTHRFGPAPGSDVAALPDLTKSADPIVLVDNEVVKISAILLKPNNSEGSAVKPGEMSVIYVCELSEIMGKFNPKKAAALGLRPGPKYRELQSGNSVKSDNLDTMVHPSDVMGPSIPGPVVLLVDCPSESHALQLFSVESLRKYYVDDSSDVLECAKTVNCIIHLSPTSVTSTPDYLKWMKRFGTAQHIMAGHQMKNVEVPILKSSARIAARLNFLCPQLFPAPGFWSFQHLDNLTTNSSTSQGPECISAENLLKFTLRPHAHLGLDRTNIPSLVTPAQVMDELFSEIPSIVDTARDVSHLWHGPREKETPSTQNYEIMIEEPWLDDNRLPSCLENVRRDDLEIVLLGTGSSQPSKYRNVSSIYINLFAKGSFLLDCGEGTLGQLKRRYGVEGADNAVRNLRCIWISHIHADHHSGVARVLALRRDLLKGVPHEPLLVIGPGQLKRFLDAYQRLEDLDMQFLNCRFTTEASWKDVECNDESNKDFLSPGSAINNEDMNKNNVNHTESNLFTKGSRMQSFWNKPVDNSTVFPLLKNLKKVLSESGLETLVSFPVVHCPQAFGIVLKAADRINTVGKVIPGWKIVYSGDTRPCTELIEASRGATVLIHEATFEDDMVEEALAKNHSTTKEAIEVGSSAGAYRIILTHFSQRYPKIPVFDSKHMHKACIAFDMMSVNLADLPVIPKALPYLKLLFKDDIPVDELDDVVDAVGAV